MELKAGTFVKIKVENVMWPYRDRYAFSQPEFKYFEGNILYEKWFKPNEVGLTTGDPRFPFRRIQKEGLWRLMVKNPNSPNNRFRHQKIVNNEQSLLRVRQEAYTRFKSEGAGDHLALVKAINFVGIADTSPKRNNRSRRRKNRN